MAHWRRDPEVTLKPDGSPVSAADLEVNALLRRVLTAARPDDGWLSEESPDDPARMRAPRCLIVDPIDGTRAFLAGGRDWSIALAVVQGGAPVAAVVHLPARGTTYAAAAGQGARRDGAPMRTAPRAAASGATVLASRSAFDAGNWTNGTSGLTRHFRSSMAYRMALVSEGRFDAMLTLHPSWDWDIAAGALLVAEAGGTATDRTGAPLSFNTRGRRSNGVIAANPALAGAIRDRLARAPGGFGAA